MDKNFVERVARDVYRTETKRDQYNVNRTPVHTHNGLDSPKLDFNSSLNNRTFFVTSHVPNTGAATAGNYGHFFHNVLNFDQNNDLVTTTSNGMSVMAITEVHGREGNDAGSVLLGIALLDPGDASLSGGTVFATFNLKNTADTPAYAVPVLGQPPVRVYPGQRLALQTSGTLTNVADVLVTIMLQY